MITEKQKQKMLKRLEGFCSGISCIYCPLWRGRISSNCLRSDLSDGVFNIKPEPEKKLCPTCGHELDKEIEDD